MYAENIILSERVLYLIENFKENFMKKHKGGADPLVQTHAFVKAVLDPKPERYDMTYRYEHTLRVAFKGKQIAEGEGWDGEPLMIACLLHDVGYPECTDFQDLKRHPAISAAIAERFLELLSYDRKLSESICLAVAIHDKWNDLPEGVTPFELSVRDADDLDRFDLMRICVLGNSDIGERNAEELLAVCEKRLTSIEDSHSRICGTQTARKLWEEELEMRRRFYERLKNQTENACRMERFILSRPTCSPRQQNFRPQR